MDTTIVSPPAGSLPLRFGSDAEFAALNAALQAAGFTERAVCERLGLERISEFRMEGLGHLKEEPEDVIGLLVWFFMEGKPLSRSGAAKLPMKELEALGAVTPHPTEPNLSYAAIMLYPTRGLFIASDRIRPMEGGPSNPPQDFVYGAIIPNTDQFLGLVPFGPCEAFLDLCSGSGVAALCAARNGARHAWAADLTGRSTQCGEFGKRLNGIRNATVVQGDLYQPVESLTFDRIAVHPPYVPVFRPRLIFDSGGQDGEQITRGIIEGLPKHLRPGGRFFALTMGSDRDQPFERRLRAWLGDAEQEFDVAFVVRSTRTPVEYTGSGLAGKGLNPDDVRAWREFFKEIGVQSLTYGFLMIQRRERARPVFTVRRQNGARTTSADCVRLLEREAAAAMAGPLRLLGARPRPAEGIRLKVEHRLEDGDWIPQSYRLTVDHPFEMEVHGHAWTAFLLGAADGSRTGMEILEKLKAEGAVSPETPAEEFAEMLDLLASGGFLEE
jgi:SAM-dependent methyltransferase